MDEKSDTQEIVESIAERLSQVELPVDDIEEWEEEHNDLIDPLDVTAEVSFHDSNQPKRFILVLGTGGPHIELVISDGTTGLVRGWTWFYQDYTERSVMNEKLMDYLFERYSEIWKAMR